MVHSPQSAVAIVAAAARPDSDEESFITQESDQWDWQSCRPCDGMENFVPALQLLGIDMAKATPNKIRREAIVPLGETPTSNVIVGEFSKKRPTRERQLILR